MQRNRIINRTVIAVHSNEPTHRRIHISRTEIVKSCYGVKLLACKEEVIFRTANAADKITKRIVYILIRNLTAFVSKRTYRAVSVIKLYRHIAVAFLTNTVINMVNNKFILYILVHDFSPHFLRRYIHI